MPLFRPNQVSRPTARNQCRLVIRTEFTVEHGSSLHHVLGAGLRISTLTVLYCLYQCKMSSHVQCRGRGNSSRSMDGLFSFNITALDQSWCDVLFNTAQLPGSSFALSGPNHTNRQTDTTHTLSHAFIRFIAIWHRNQSSIKARSRKLHPKPRSIQTRAENKKKRKFFFFSFCLDSRFYGERRVSGVNFLSG